MRKTGKKSSTTMALTGEGWSPWDSIGGNCVFGPAVASRGRDMHDLFAVGTNNALYHRAYTPSSHWGQWEAVGGECRSGPAAVARGGLLDVVVVAADDHLTHLQWNGSSWSPWKPIGDIRSPYGDSSGLVALTSRDPQSLDCFLFGGDTIFQISWQRGAWGDPINLRIDNDPEWDNLGGGIAAISVPGSAIHLAATNVDRNLLHKWWTGTTWTPWENLGGRCMYGVSIAAKDQGRMDFFTIGEDGALWDLTWDGAQWLPWESVGGICLEAPASIAMDRLHVFVIGQNYGVFHRWYPSSSPVSRRVEKRIDLLPYPPFEGPIPYRATYPPAGYINGHLDGARNPSANWTYQMLTLSGGTTELRPQAALTQDQMTQIFGSPTPRLPARFLTFVAAPPGEEPPAGAAVPLDITYTFNG